MHDAHQTRHQLSSPSFVVISPSGSLLIPSARFYSSLATFRVHGSTYGPYQHATSTPPFPERMAGARMKLSTSTPRSPIDVSTHTCSWPSTGT